jgi:hypothetical protein
LYDSVLDRAIEPGQFGIVAAKGARLQAASQRRLVLAIDKATAAQEQTNRRIERLERVGIWIAIVGTMLAAVQVSIAIWEATLER